jgi:hydroxymethylglutaryl-CoA lyase
MKIVECPRDAIQGIKNFIPTKLKAEYINELLKAGFDTIDFGSFVSPKMIPQMSDTAEVLQLLDLNESKSRLLAIVANERGAEEALTHCEISYLGYPFSISETFQMRNTGAGIQESLERVKTIQQLCLKHERNLVIYISMAFGNPYDEKWDVEIALKWIDELSNLDIKTFSLADTIGVATPSAISYIFKNLIPSYPYLEFGAHFHTHPENWKGKVEAAWEAGCHRFDGAILGYGGCPMAKDELIGNMATENLINFFTEKGVQMIDDRHMEQLQHSFQKLITASSY